LDGVSSAAGEIVIVESVVVALVWYRLTALQHECVVTQVRNKVDSALWSRVGISATVDFDEQVRTE
jgi:hypothetical protein